MEHERLIGWSKEILMMAEELIGSKCNDWGFYHEILFNDGPPSLIYFPECNIIKISLTKKIQWQESSEYEVVTQLAHEIGHVISPARSMVSNKFSNFYINEGVSEYLSFVVVNKFFGVIEEDFVAFKKQTIINIMLH